MSLNGLFLSFSALCDLKNTFFRKKIKINFFLKKNFSNFSNSCSLNIFEPKIWRRLGTFPSCSSIMLYTLPLELEMHFYTILSRKYSVFLHTIPGETKGYSPASSFFGIARLFSDFFPKGSPFHIYATEWLLKNPKASPFQFFGIVKLFEKKITKGSPFTFFLMICNIMDEKSQRVPWHTNAVQLLGFSGRREYSDTLKSFCYF